MAAGRLLGVLVGMVLCFAAGLQASPLPHDYHVSVTEIHYNPERQSLECTIKLFCDDIEASIEQIGGGKLHLGEEREAANADQILHNYLKNRLKLQVNGQAVDLVWLGKEVELDAVWIYVEVPSLATISKLFVRNRILLESFEDQANVVHVDVLEARQSLFLNKSLLEDVLAF